MALKLLSDYAWPKIDNLKAWLHINEQNHGTVTEGAEKHIEYADPDNPGKTPFAVLYLHGFSATRQEIAPVPERVARALGANYFGTRLTGHGLDGPSLGQATAGDWLKDTAEAWQVACELGDKVIVISCSTGGTLATWLAEQPSAQDRLAALVLFSPNFQPRHWGSRLFAWPWSRYWLPWIAGENRRWQPVDELSAKYWTHSYPTRVLHEMQALVNRVRRSPVESIVTPSLFIYSDDDRVVNARYTQAVFRRWGSSIKERIRIEGEQDNSNHVITGDIVAPEKTAASVEQILNFLGQYRIASAIEKTGYERSLQRHG